MPDWKRYHVAIVAGTPLAEIANACELAWEWLDLTREERSARIRESIGNEASARWMLQALNFVRQRVMREFGIAPDDGARFGALFGAVRAGDGSPDQIAVVRRYDTAREIGDAVAAFFPAANAPSLADPDAQALATRVTELTAAIQACDVGRVTPVSMTALRTAIDVFDAAGRDLNGPVLREYAWWLSRAWWAAGRSALELGRNDEGREAFERAASSAERAGDAKCVEECRERLRDLAQHRMADFDSAAERELQALLIVKHPLGRAQALLRLAAETGAAGDKFEAERLAAEAAQALEESGYPDPENDVDAAIDQWIATASTSCSSTALVAQLCEVAQHWAGILRARFNDRVKTDAPAAARAEASLRAVGARANDFYEQAGHAEQSAAERFALWCPEAKPLEARHSVDESKLNTAQQLALLDALHEVRLACNAAPSEALLERVTDLIEQAEALGSRFHIAFAQLEYAYVLIALGRFAEVSTRTMAATRALLGDNNEARLSSFATGYERDLYLMSIQYQAQALVGQRQFEALLTLCEPVIRDIEAERARVNSPYQQSTFLACAYRAL